jgi:hypothetical protein
MIKYITLIAMTIFSFGCTATTCLISEESIAENSEKYSSRVDIKTIKNGDIINVIVEVPKKLNGKVLKNIILQRNSEDGTKGVIEAPLKIYVEKEKSRSWYNISDDLFSNTFIAIDYGQNCGISIKYRVN